jgi:hypothetical protein
MKGDGFAKQFRGPMPQEPISPLGPIYREASPPTASRKRQGVAIGSQTEAWPGMAGKQGRMAKATGRRDY